MNVNGIGKQPCYERTNGVGKNNKNHVGSFSKNLSENLNGRAENDSVREENAASAASVLTSAFPYRNGFPVFGVRENVRTGTEDAGAGAEAGTDRQQAVKDCEVRHITCQESSCAKAFALEGFSLMAQVDRNSRSVYVEQKLEDGTVKGYEVNIDKLEPGTEDPVERMALEAWEKKGAGEEKELTELSVEEALAEFYDFIQDRIKNGPPKYMIGNSEFSVTEWDKLLEDFDDQLDALREEMRERIEKMQAQQQKAELSQKLQGLQDEVQEAAEEETEEKLLTALFQNKSM